MGEKDNKKMLIARKKELQKFASKLGIGLSPEVHLSWDAYFAKVK